MPDARRSTTARRRPTVRRPAAALALSAAGVAVLGGASTYALWSTDVAAGSGSSITAGDLDAASVGDLEWTTDVDAEEQGVLGSGEHAWAVQGFDLALDGHNLVADATVDVTLSADLDYPYQWFVSTDPAITDPRAAIADGIPGHVFGPSSAAQATREGLTEADLPDSLDGSADWFLYVLVENPYPLAPGDPAELDVVTVRGDLTLEQAS
ncbi:hypothetical protein [Georgenia sp. Z1491]|uniref:hypothetical protein n=1 Tax=Georgenia sp. Z1491 TaxID=3416707 RepID=UPI003CE698AB